MAEIETGTIYCDDALARLAAFPRESVDLVYLDPPFFSNRKYEVIWGDEAEVRSFEDRWDGGIQVYVAWMRERVMELYRVLKPTGTLYLHCDWHASHYLKVMLDEVFGRDRFRNEIIWRYRRWPSKQQNFQRMHDTILRYSKSDEVTWNQLFEPLSEQTSKRIPGGGKIVTTLDEHGKKRIRETGEPSKGVPMSDVWEISQIVGPTAERLGYPTQKPENLLRRIIESSSNPGDIVLDPFCGSGTAIAAAQTLRRRWIGIDISPTAVRVMQARMAALGVTANVVGMPITDEELRALKPFEFQNLVITAMNGTHAPRGKPPPKRIYSSVDGVLRVLSGGDRIVWAGLREHRTNAFVRCRFDADEWRDRLGSFWEQRVTVEGLVAYDDNRRPRSIHDVRRVTPRHRRSMAGLGGKAPSLTGGLSDDDFVSTIRGHD